MVILDSGGGVRLGVFNLFISSSRHKLGMSCASDRPLWRTQLCRHGPDHASRSCRYAHSLLDLTPPDEGERSYCDKWRSGQFDRFYGQRMTPAQLTRIRFYFALLPACDIPVWAMGLSLLERELEHCQGYALPWDFGISRDRDDLLSRRLVGQGPFPCPFEDYPHLWERLQLRRRRMLCYRYPSHELGVRSLSYPPLPEWRFGVDAGGCPMGRDLCAGSWAVADVADASYFSSGAMEIAGGGVESASGLCSSYQGDTMTASGSGFNTLEHVPICLEQGFGHLEQQLFMFPVFPTGSQVGFADCFCYEVSSDLSMAMQYSGLSAGDYLVPGSQQVYSTESVLWSPPAVVSACGGLPLSAPPFAIFYPVDELIGEESDWAIDLQGAGVEACGLSLVGL